METESGLGDKGKLHLPRRPAVPLLQGMKLNTCLASGISLWSPGEWKDWRLLRVERTVFTDGGTPCSVSRPWNSKLSVRCGNGAGTRLSALEGRARGGGSFSTTKLSPWACLWGGLGREVSSAGTGTCKILETQGPLKTRLHSSETFYRNRTPGSQPAGGVAEDWWQSYQQWAAGR